ncbi:MAG: hypothetical protein Q6363_009760 [Candidatus Njordarchaeota archaeon]
METIIPRRPVDKIYLCENVPKIIKFIPEWADGLLYVFDDDVWRPAKKSRRGNWYSRNTWKPIFAKELWSLGHILIRLSCLDVCGWSYRVGIISREEKIYLGCAWLSEDKKTFFIKLKGIIRLTCEDRQEKP